MFFRSSQCQRLPVPCLQAGDFDDARTQRTAGGRTARRSAWAASDIFGSDDGGVGGAATVRCCMMCLKFA